MPKRSPTTSTKPSFLEDELKSYIPATANVELTNKPDWRNSSATLVAEFHVSVPNWASAAGRRTLLPAALFGGGEKHVFESEFRVHPIYFNFPYTENDDVTITPPSGVQISNLPQPQTIDVKACAYNLTAEQKNGTLHQSRRLMMNIQMVDVKYYNTLRAFFQRVRSADEQQIVLAPISSTK